MFSRTNLVSLFVAAILLFSSVIIAQDAKPVVGKLFTEEEALEMFGDVVDSVEINTTELKDYLDQTGEYIMFLLKEGNAVICDNNRSVFYNPGEIDVTPELEMNLFSASKVRELIENGSEPVTILQNRKEKFTVSNGSLILEVSEPCPPFCE